MDAKPLGLTAEWGGCLGAGVLREACCKAGSAFVGRLGAVVPFRAGH